MAITKIDAHIPSHQISQERVKEATSGKKERLQNLEGEVKKTSLGDKPIFSDDAKKLQETEVILQNALQKLLEMDELNHSNLLGIKDKLESGVYDEDQVAARILDDIIPEQEIRATMERRTQAEKYVSRLSDIDDTMTIDERKLDKIRERLASGYYDRAEVIDSIAQNLAEVIEY